MKIVYLTTRLPIPTTDGRSFTLKQQLDILSKNNELYLISMNQGNKDINYQPTYLKKVETLNYPNLFTKLLNLVKYTFFGFQPLQMSVVYSSKERKKFEKFVNNIHPDIIICDMLRLSKYMKNLTKKYKSIMDIDDLLSKRYLRSLDIPNVDALGQFNSSIPNVISKIIHILKMDKLILKIEAKRMKMVEEKSATIYNKLVLVSPLETKEFNKALKTTAAVCWPTCVKYSLLVEENYNDKQLCYLGNMDYLPNQITLDYIISNIFNKLNKDYKLLVIGKCSNETKEKYKKYDFISVTQEVPSVEPYVKSSLCLLAPIQYGSGVKTKILEAMGFGVPVITTTIGAEGIIAKNEEEIFVTNNDDKTLEYIFKLADKNVRNTVARNALNFIKNNHSYTIGEKIISETLEEVKLDKKTEAKINEKK